ncbi:MAG: 4Fe-4S dicluster domain-containing protein [Clostridia bacterium]|nr:4Fe-4S dicluster domain-containing protein [Clostridia bacterium]
MIIKDIIREAGIIGAGGAGFPTYAKLAEGADTLLINGVECEPLLYTDYILMREQMPFILRGAHAVMAEYHISRALLCMKEHTVEALGLTDGQELDTQIFVKQLPNVYPIGDEISMIYEATRRIVRPGALPITVGVIVCNAETAYNIAHAVKHQTPVTEKWLMIGGAVDAPIVFRCPIGTSIRELFAFYNIIVPADHVVLDGGPSMGNIIPWQTEVVKKNTKALLILPKNIPAIVSKMTDVKVSVNRCASNCCQCTRCTDMCPRGLLGYPLEPHRMVRSVTTVAEVSPEMVRAATLCCGCGVCEIAACCQGISPKTIISEFKKILAKNGIRYSADEDVTPSPDRAYRMLPAERWKSLLGVSPYDKVAELAGRHFVPTGVAVPLNRHIGAPSIPCVAEGASVKKGDKIAEAAEGLSVPQHAPIDGRITLITNNKITIERV